MAFQMIMRIFDFSPNIISGQNLCTFYVSEKINLLPQFFYRMVVIGLLSMVGNRTGVGVLHWEALGGRWEGGGEGWVWESDL